MENVGRASQSGGTRYYSLSTRFQTFLDFFFLFLSPPPFTTNPIFLFSYFPVLFPFKFLFRLYVSSFSISACRVFLRIVFFFYPFVSSATHFSFALLPSSRTLVPSRFKSELGAGVDIGSICDLPRATITCNTVGLSGPMGTRWGVLFVRKKDITVTHIESGAAPLMKGTICRSCLIMVDVSDDLSGASLQLDVRMFCLSCEWRIYIIKMQH